MQELFAARAPHGARISLHDHVLEAETLEDALVGIALRLVGGIETRVGVVERVGVFHRELPAAQQADATEQEVKRGVLLQVALLSGAGEDVSAARTKFGAGPVEVPRQVFMNALGRTMWIVSEIFDRAHLNQPDIEKIFVTHATKSVEPALESDNEELKKQAEELKEDIEEKQKLDEQIRKRQR